MEPAPHAFAPAYTSNTRRETVYGGEIWGAWSPVARWKLMPSYSWLQRKSYLYWALGGATQYQIPSEDPKHSPRLRSMVDLSRTWQLDAAIYYTSAIAYYRLPGDPKFDLRINWRPTRRQEWSFGVFDALEKSGVEAAPEGPFLSSEARRNWQLKWVYRF